MVKAINKIVVLFLSLIFPLFFSISFFVFSTKELSYAISFLKMDGFILLNIVYAHLLSVLPFLLFLNY